jgi:NhaP-type Na+/H+ or K+/H+ antiporter
MTFLVVFALLVFGYGLVSARVERVATAPIIFTVVGLLAPILLPGLVDPDFRLSHHLWVAEAGLVLLLFTDATRTDLVRLKAIRGLPARLLGPGMLLTIGLGALVAWLVFPQLSVWEACALATILSPTDAGLGQVIVQSPLVPEGVREALNVEAGLNDGLAVPFLLFFMAMMEARGGGTEASLVQFLGQQLGFGLLLGAGIGLGGGWLLHRAKRAGWMTEGFTSHGVLALPVLCFVLSAPLGASMFIAAFVAGLAVRVTFPRAGAHAVEFAEQSGQLLNLAVFLLFGFTVGQFVSYLEPRYVVYGLLSLTVVRMLPVALAMTGAGLDRATTLFMGWFGPRGLASIVLGLVFVERELHAPGDTTMQGVILVTILLSILLHGFTAQPGIAWYARRLGSSPSGAPDLDDRGPR